MSISMSMRMRMSWRRMLRLQLHHTAKHCNTQQLSYANVGAHNIDTTVNERKKRKQGHTPHEVKHTATHCNTLQHTATHCNSHIRRGTLHYMKLGKKKKRESSKCNYYINSPGAMVKAHCNTLQHTATHRNTLQHTATHCNTLQHSHMSRNSCMHECSLTHCSTLQHGAVHCNTLQHTEHTTTHAYVAAMGWLRWVRFLKL